MESQIQLSSIFNKKYEKIKILGEGNYGKAILVKSLKDNVIINKYLSYNIFINLQTLAVIKSIDLSKLTKDQIKDANLEGDILKGLDHPNIIKFLEVQTDNNYLYIVMDYADGGDLSMKIKDQNGVLFPEDKILDWFTQVCLAIKHIHDRKILHRDIKSQNIFLMKNGTVKLGDFGIAKCLDQTIDKAKTYVGTPYYLSPEIINSQPYGFQSDIWSLGVLLYEMCALKMPFDASNLPQLYIKIINCNYQPLNKMYSEELKKLVKDMLNETSLKRPTISKILENPLIKPRIRKFLNDKYFNSEFSHTILHNFKLGEKNGDEKMTKYELITNNNNNMNNNINNNYMNNIRFSQGHQRPMIKKDINERNLRISANDKNINYHYQQKERERELNRINQLKKNLEGKPNNINNNRQNRPAGNKYNGNNIHNYGNNNMNNNIARGFYIINEGKDYKRNDTGRIKKNKNSGKEEFSSDKMGKNLQNKNNINNNDNYYNGLRSENSAKYNSGKKRMEYDKKNNINNNNNINTGNNITSSNMAVGNSSHRDKDKERKQKLEEFKRKSRLENKNKISNSNGVIWMWGNEKYSEKNSEVNTTEATNFLNNKDNSNSNIIAENIIIDKNNDNIINNSNKKEINGKNLLPLNNISNHNINNINNSYDSINEEEIDNNNRLYKDVMKGNNNIYNENNFNGMENIDRKQDFLGNMAWGDEKNLEIDGERVTGDIYDEIFKEFGKDLTIIISNIIKKYVNDDMLTYDPNKINENIFNELKSKKIPHNIIEKAINKIPDIYFLQLTNKI